MRLDKWLWAVRVFKTRTLAAEACKAGHVKVDGATAKPAHEVRPGESIVVTLASMTRTLKALAAPASRVSGKLVPSFAEDLTPPEEFARQRQQHVTPSGLRPKGAGRPTKRERRDLERMLDP